MKPAPFEYHSPHSLEEALGLMANLGDQARPLAGGQSLVPMLSMRLARPAAIVDLNGIADLAYHRVESDALVVGAPGRAWHHVAGSVPGWLSRHANCPVIVVP